MAHKLLMFLKRRADLSLAEFRAYYEERHVPLCLPGMRGVESYVRRYVEPNPGAPEDFDVITEIWIGDRATLDAILAAAAADAMPADIVADEANFLDRSRSRFCAVEEVESDLSYSKAPPSTAHI